MRNKQKKKSKKKSKKKEDIPEKIEIIDKYKFPYEFTRLLDIDRVLRTTKNKKKLKITLVRDEIKGTSVYTTKPIKMDEVIAYYKIRVFNMNSYESPTNYIYAFSIYGAAEREYKTLIGDIDCESLPEPINDISFWGLFINEPSNGNDINSWVDTDYNYNFVKHGRKKLKCGTYLIYKIIANRDIDIGEEVTIYYGTEYDRDYKLDIKK